MTTPNLVFLDRLLDMLDDENENNIHQEILDEIRDIMYYNSIMSMYQEREDDIIRMVENESLQAYDISRNNSVELDYSKYTSSTNTTTTTASEMNEKCSICFELYTNTNTGSNSNAGIESNNAESNRAVIYLDCLHHFHAECINEWAKYKQECPICRQKIQTVNTNYSCCCSFN